jgi:hypothetical protein
MMAKILRGFSLNAAFGNDVRQELPPGDPECAFFWVQLNGESSEVVDGFF